MHCLGLDIGSTTIKGAVLDLERNEPGLTVTRPFPMPVAGLPPGWIEFRPNDIEVEVRHVVGELLAAAPDCAGLFCSGQMGGLVLVDRAGKALTNYLSWRDQRTLQPTESVESTLQAIRERWSDSELSDVGNELQAGSASALLFWLKEHGQLPPQAMPATAADYVLGRLCGVSPQTDPTQAIGLLHLQSGTWHQDAFEVLGLSDIRWPQIAEFKSPMGEATIHGRTLTCYPSFGDQQCALRGAGLTRNELSINISTGSQVSRRTATFQPGPFQSRRYFGDDFLNTITHLPAGRSLNVLCDLLLEYASEQGQQLSQLWDLIADRAATSDGGGLSVDPEFFSGHQGYIKGITTENLTIGNLFHATFQSMAENYACCAERLGSNHTKLSLVLSGGLSRTMPVLRQLIQARFNRPVRESRVSEETLLGLLDVAGEVYGRSGKLSHA